MNASFWEGKKVLITGHTGFKGGWLSLWLQEKGTQVIGYALPPPTTPSFFELSEVARNMTCIQGDVRHLNHLIEVIQKHEPEIVIHLAAQPIVRYSYQYPVETYETNVMGTLNVLEAVRQTKSASVVLIITSDKCYQNNEWIWGYRENEPMGGRDPYSSSKACAELLTAAYRQSFFQGGNRWALQTSVASARAGNVIGGGDWGADRLIPDVMRAIKNGSPVVIRNPQSIRPWQFVLEPLNGYLCLVEKLWHSGEQIAGGWNFGPPDADCKSVSWMLNELSSLWDGGIAWEQDTSDQPHENVFLKLDSSKARSLLGWSSKLRVSDALQWVAQWYRAYFKGMNLRELSCQQISQYEQLVGL